jgi:beta-alanine degradation protein BauB
MQRSRWRFVVLALGALLCACASRGWKSLPDQPPSTPTPAVGPSSFPSPDRTDGDKYHLLLENQQVRVFRYHDQPGDKTHLHHHDAFVLYALSSFRRRLIFPDGSVKERDFTTGEVLWMPEQVHIGENIGSTDTEVLIVEHKPR